MKQSKQQFTVAINKGVKLVQFKVVLSLINYNLFVLNVVSNHRLISN